MIGLRLKPEEEQLIRAYVDVHGMNVSEFARKAMLKEIEDEYDLKLYNEAMEEYKENPVTYTLEEVEKELNL
jgi:uncharacterized protein (DUF1778 family)